VTILFDIRLEIFHYSI